MIRTRIHRLAAAVVAMMAATGASSGAAEPTRPFQDLWIPPAVSGTSFELALGKSSRSFWPGATTATYSFNQTGFWGPTLILNQGDDVKIRVRNDLDEPTTVHWHGLHLPAAMDGGPHQIIPAGGTWTPHFTVKNNAGTYWYHPHAHETTQKQLTYGAGGLIIIRDPAEAALDLPRTYGVDDIPLVFTSRRFYPDDQFSFEGDNDKYGDFLLANGTLDPRVSLPAQMVRLRILNAEIERGYNLGFSDDRTFFVIANDGGLLDRPVAVKRMMLMVGERVEVLVDLGADRPGSAVELIAYNADHPFGFPGGEPGRGRPNGSDLNNIGFRLLRIDVTAPTPANRVTRLPGELAKNRYWTESDATNRRTIRITGGRPGTSFSFDDEFYAMHATRQVVKLGAVEAWTVVNNRVFGHSFHLHDVPFKIVARSNGPVADYEQGWKDTVYIPRNQSVTFVARFDDFASETDPFMYHCHMANHEDGGLMGEFLVVKDPEWLGKSPAGPIAFREPREHPVTPAMLAAAGRRASTSAPGFKTVDLNGGEISLAALTATKPLVLYFIEHACPCSRDATPFLERIRAAYGDSCTVLGVIDARPEIARAWAKQVGARFPIVADADLALIHAYDAEQSVTTTVVAPGGTIVKTYPGYSTGMLGELSATIARLGHVPVRPIDVDGAPPQLVAGCSFPSR